MISVVITADDVIRSEKLIDLDDVVKFVESFCKNGIDFSTNVKFNKFLVIMAFYGSFEGRVNEYHYMWWQNGKDRALILMRIPPPYICGQNMRRIYYETPLTSGGKMQYSVRYRGYKLFKTLVQYTYRMTNPPKDNKWNRLGVFWLSPTTIDKIVQNDQIKTKFAHKTLSKFYETYSKKTK